MKRPTRARSLLCLAPVLLFAATLRADEIDFARHHDSGLAVLTIDGQRAIGAYQADDFDPQHTPELGMTTLARIVVACFGPATCPTVSGDSVETIQLSTGIDASTLRTWRGATLWTLAADYSVRSHILGLGRTSVSAVKRIIIRNVDGCIEITITDPCIGLR